MLFTHLVNCRFKSGKKIGYDVPLEVNMQPAGKYLARNLTRAGAYPA